MRFDSHKKSVLALLGDLRFHSGTELSRHLGVSRTTVWKILQELQAAGIEFAALPGRGYRLTRPVEILCADRIRSALSPEASQVLDGIDLFDEIDSTSGHLMRLAGEGVPCGRACLAEVQTSGRGRLGRAWQSPLGANIYLSILWRFGAYNELAGLSLAVGVAMVRALESAGAAGIGLKWPNDLMWDDRKLGGILLEVAGEAHGGCAVVVGLGLNRYIPASVAEAIDQPWTDLSEAMGDGLPGRNALAAALLDHLLPLLRDYSGQGLSHYLPDWRRYHCMADRPVEILQGDVRIEGKIVDVTEDGSLLVESRDGSRQTFSSGDVRLRLATGLH